MTTSIVREAFYPHPPARVWRALTEPAALSAWLMPNDFQPRLGHRFTFLTEPVPPHFDGVVRCEVTELDPPRRLAYTWLGGPELETRVRFRLLPESGGTRLHFEHSGFDLDRPAHLAAYQGMSSGWPGIIADRLRQAVDDLG